MGFNSLVMTNITMENHRVKWVYQLFLWPFSIAVLQIGNPVDSHSMEYLSLQLLQVLTQHMVELCRMSILQNGMRIQHDPPTTSNNYLSLNIVDGNLFRAQKLITICFVLTVFSLLWRPLVAGFHVSPVCWNHWGNPKSWIPSTHHFHISSHAPDCSTPVWLVVGLPLWKIWKSIGMIISNLWENTSHVPVTTNQLFKPLHRFNTWRTIVRSRRKPGWTWLFNLAMENPL